MTPADVITKALNDLTQALKGRNNQKGIDQIEALTKLNNILSNAPEPDPTSDDPMPELRTIPTEPQRITFDETTKLPQTEVPSTEIPLPRVMEPTKRKQPEPMHKVRIDKAIPNVQTPRVEKPKTNLKSNDNRERIRNYLSTKSMARIPQLNMHLR